MIPLGAGLRASRTERSGEAGPSRPAVRGRRLTPFGGTRGARCSHFWPGAWSVGPWLEGRAANMR